MNRIPSSNDAGRRESNLDSSASGLVWRPSASWFLFALVLLAAIAARLPGLVDPNPTFNLTRELQIQANVARLLFRVASEPSGSPSTAITWMQLTRVGLFELPFASLFAAVWYTAIGTEDPIFLKVFNASAWLLGAVPLYQLLRRSVGRGPASAAAAVYWLAPFGVRISTAMIPEPLMVSLALLCVNRFDGIAASSRVTSSLLLTAATLLAKIQIAPFLACVYIAKQAERSLNAARAAQIFGLLALALVPAALWYAALLIWVTGGPFSHAGDTFVNQGSLAFGTPRSPYLDLLTRSFYVDVALRINGVLPLPVAIVGIAGALSPRCRELLPIGAGLVGGYVLFGLLVPTQFRDTVWYHVMLIPIAAIGLANLLDRADAWGWLRMPGVSRSAKLLAAGASFTIIIMARPDRLLELRRELVAGSGATQVEFDALGTAARHSTSTILLCNDCPRIERRADVAGAYWPYQANLADDRERRGIVPSDASTLLRTVSAGVGGATYFVVADPDEWRRQSSLREVLEPYCSKEAGRKGWQLIDLGRLRGGGDSVLLPFFSVDGREMADLQTSRGFGPLVSAVGRGDQVGAVRVIAAGSDPSNLKRDVTLTTSGGAPTGVEVWARGHGVLQLSLEDDRSPPWRSDPFLLDDRWRLVSLWGRWHPMSTQRGVAITAEVSEPAEIALDSFRLVREC